MGSAVVYIGVLALVTAGVAAAPGILDAQGLLAPPVLIGALAAIALSMQAYRWAIARTRRRAYDLISALQTVLQVLWINVLAWSLPPTMDLVAAGILFGFVVAWSFLDATQIYDDKGQRIAYGVGFVGFWPLLGLLYSLDLVPGELRAPGTLRLEQFVVLQLMLMLISQAVMVVVGRQTRTADEQQAAAAAASRTAAVEAAEDATRTRAARVMGSALQARRFQHDAASPLQVARTMALLVSEEAPPEAAPHAQALTASLDELAGMLERARSSDQPLEWRGTADLAEDLRRGFAAVMAGHEAEAAAPEIDLEDAEVEVSTDHVDSIASLMVNGALQRPDTPIEVRGRVDTGGRYTLTIRDHGVAPADRGPALERVRAGLGLHTAGAAERSPSYRGMGIGLPLCSLQLSLHGARVWAREPSEGRGLELVVQLPSAADRNPSLEPTRTRP